MSSMNFNYENIEKYYLGELNPKELEAFEEKMKTDKHFKAEVELYIDINNTLNQKYSHLDEVKSLKTSLKKIDQQHFESKPKLEQSNNKYRFYLSRVAAIAAILIIGFFILKPKSNLYNQFALHQEISVQTKGDNQTILNEAVIFYNSKKYKKAIPLFKSYLKSNSNDIEINMALGVCLLEQDQIQEAQKIFTAIYEKDNIFKNKASWYLALSSLKTKDLKQTKSYLNEISSDSFYYKNAQKLLKKID